jgi:hypothetical protein
MSQSLTGSLRQSFGSFFSELIPAADRNFAFAACLWLLPRHAVAGMDLKGSVATALSAGIGLDTRVVEIPEGAVEHPLGEKEWLRQRTLVLPAESCRRRPRRRDRSAAK